MQRWENFSKEELQFIVSSSTSIAEIARKIGYSDKSCGGYKGVYKMIERYQFDTTHLLGQGWNKDTYDMSRLQNGISVKSNVLKRILVHQRGYKCEQCGADSWNGQQIPLEVHHIDGDTLNNTNENLLLLCPNCHSLTKNWRKPNTEYISDNEFIEALIKCKNIRQALLYLDLSPKGANYKRAHNLQNQITTYEDNRKNE